MSGPYMVRFVDDPIAYRVVTTSDPKTLVEQRWVYAFRGITDDAVLIDVSKAYLVEELQR